MFKQKNLGSNLSKFENRSIKSSDYSSSGHGSDVELLSSSKSKSKKNKQLQSMTSQSFQQTTTNYYEIAQFPPASATPAQQVKLTSSASFSKGTTVSAATSSTVSSATTTSSSSASTTSGTFKTKKMSQETSQTALTQQRSLDKVPQELRLSKQSFHAAMGNPCEFFVDVM